MYANKDFKTKKEFKAAVANGEEVRVYQPAGIGLTPTDGRVCVEGPHFPKPHTWWATATLKGGVVVKVE